jgi:hypothetical protein
VTRLTHSRTRGRVACSLGRLTSAASVWDRRQAELKTGTGRQAVNRIAPRQKSKGLLDISNPSKRRSTDHEIVAPSFWEYPSRTVTHRSERMCHLHRNGNARGTVNQGGNTAWKKTSLIGC